MSEGSDEPRDDGCRTAGITAVLGLLLGKVGPDDLLMQVVVGAEIDDHPLPLTLILNNGVVAEGVVGSDMRMAEAVDSPIRATIEAQLDVAIATNPEKAEDYREGQRRLAGRGIASWLSDLHEHRSKTAERLTAEGATRWQDGSDEEIIFQTQFTHRTAITLRDARVTIPGSKPVTIPVMRVSLKEVSCWWPRALR